MEEKIICTHCDQPVDCGYELVNGQIVCSDCVSHYCCVCDRCGSTIWDTDAFGDEYTNLCRSCYENFYVRCERCECLIHSDDAYEYDGYRASSSASYRALFTASPARTSQEFLKGCTYFRPQCNTYVKGHYQNRTVRKIGSIRNCNQLHY